VVVDVRHQFTKIPLNHFVQFHFAAQERMETAVEWGKGVTEAAHAKLSRFLVSRRCTRESFHLAGLSLLQKLNIAVRYDQLDMAFQFASQLAAEQPSNYLISLCVDLANCAIAKQDATSAQRALSIGRDVHLQLLRNGTKPSVAADRTASADFLWEQKIQLVNLDY